MLSTLMWQERRADKERRAGRRRARGGGKSEKRPKRSRRVLADVYNIVNYPRCP